MIFCSFTPAPLPCPLFHNCASLTRRPSTNPHFGVFLPPVALVGDLMQSPVAVRLQVNQVRTFPRNCDPSLLWRLAIDVSPSYSRLDSGCYRAVWGVHQRLLIVQRQLMLGLAVMVSKVVRCSTVTWRIALIDDRLRTNTYINKCMRDPVLTVLNELGAMACVGWLVYLLCGTLASARQLSSRAQTLELGNAPETWRARSRGATLRVGEGCTMQHASEGKGICCRH